MMTSEESLLLKNRQNEFSAFYADLLPSLVDFIGRIGIQPALEVLKTAVQFKALVSQATESFSIDSEEDRIWLVTRLGYYIGEYFVQKHSGCWYVNEIPNSRYFARFVVGRFNISSQRALMLDPFEVAAVYVSQPQPRSLASLLAEVETEILELR